MMRPKYFFSLVLFFFPVGLVAQDPVACAMRTTVWSDEAVRSEGIGWSAFTRQFYCVSNWNVSGVSVDYSKANGQSAILFCRDGIPGFSWYHLYLSHFMNFKRFGGMLQLRFSVIDLADPPLVFRLGGNVRTTWSMSPTLELQIGIYDFTGWIFPSAGIARGDPAMQFLLLHEPGRLIGLTTGFQLSRSQFGPVTAGVRVNVSDGLGLIAFMDVLPFGLSIGITYQLNGYGIKGWLEHRNGMGLTPMVEISSKREAMSKPPG
jgi:hypothetical protein